METEASLPCSEKHATAVYPESDESTQCIKNNVI